MRKLALTILTIASVSATAPAQAQTYGGGAPVCLQVYGQFPYIDCSYATLQQCAASASGRSAQCLLNPYPPTRR